MPGWTSQAMSFCRTLRSPININRTQLQGGEVCTGQAPEQAIWLALTDPVQQARRPQTSFFFSSITRGVGTRAGRKPGNQKLLGNKMTLPGFSVLSHPMQLSMGILPRGLQFS